MFDQHRIEIEWAGRPLVLETGKIARQADGAVLATYGDLHGGAVRFNEVPPYLVQAIVATEDRRFFDHMGVDAIGILRAAFANLRAGAVRQGLARAETHIHQGVV